MSDLQHIRRSTISVRDEPLSSSETMGNETLASSASTTAPSSRTTSRPEPSPASATSTTCWRPSTLADATRRGDPVIPTLATPTNASTPIVRQAL